MDIHTKHRHVKKGFTIVELVIVIAVIAILAAVLIPTFSSIVESAHRSSAFQQATNEFKDMNNQYLIISGGQPLPDGRVFEVNGYYFVNKGGKLESITEEEALAMQGGQIKNIIYLIPDGAGFGTYDIANALKTKYGTGVYGQATPVTTDAIEGMTVSGLYLDEFMIATADTSMVHEYGKATDSTAAGTALLTGHKTDYVMAGITADMKPVANILELCRLEGKSTGFVTTKCLVDATPSAGMVHVLKRPDQAVEYQIDASQQILNCGIDVLLAYGSDGGYYRMGSVQGAPLHGDRSTNHGYTTITDRASLYATVNSGATKVMSNVYIDYTALTNQGYTSITLSNYYAPSNAYNTDYQAHHLLYDVDAKQGVDITLMDYAKNALKLLSENIDNKNGFCLIIEGGAIDNAAEGRNVKEAVGEYLAFDEVFAYCVNWAKSRTDTIVIACPDHDSGGFYNPSNTVDAPIGANSLGTIYSDIDSLVDALHSGTVSNNTTLAGAVGGHSPQNVPVWLYAPDSVRSQVLSALGLPVDASASKVRTGRFYNETVINPAYTVNNSDIAPAIVKVANLMSFSMATDALFANANSYGTYDFSTEVFTFNNGAKVKRNTTYYIDVGGTRHDFEYGMAIYMTNPIEYKTYDGTNTTYSADSIPNKAFYVPKCVLAELGFIS